MVPRTGLEPVTYGLELHDSIQLSYRGASESTVSFHKSKSFTFITPSSRFFLSILQTVPWFAKLLKPNSNNRGDYTSYRLIIQALQNINRYSLAN